MAQFTPSSSRDPLLLFIGDSITDTDWRSREHGPLGYGYVGFIAEELAERGEKVVVANRGVSGNQAMHLIERWSTDVIQMQPDVLTIMVGINDTWRRYDSDYITTTEQFERNYRLILEIAPQSQIILIEPFLLPLSSAQAEWRDDLDPKIEVVRKLAESFDATLIRLDELLGAEAQKLGAEKLAWDGVHLTRLGHRLLTNWWIDTVIG